MIINNMSKVLRCKQCNEAYATTIRDMLPDLKTKHSVSIGNHIEVLNRIGIRSRLSLFFSSVLGSSTSS